MRALLQIVLNGVAVLVAANLGIGISYTGSLLGLVGYATDETVGLFYTSILAAVFMVLAFHRLFGGGSAFFNVINWGEVARRLSAAKK